MTTLAFADEFDALRERLAGAEGAADLVDPGIERVGGSGVLHA